MAKGDPATRAHVIQVFKNQKSALSTFRTFTVKKKKNLDAEGAYDCLQQVHLMKAELETVSAHLVETIRVRKEDQPTSKEGGKRIKKPRAKPAA